MFGPQIQGGAPGAAVDHQGAAEDLVQADAAATCPGIVGGQSDIPGLVADQRVGPEGEVQRGADHGEVATPFGEAAGGAVVADQTQFGLGVLAFPPRARRCGGGAPVGGRRRTRAGRPAAAARVHGGPVASGAGAGAGVRRDEPVPVRGDRADRARAGRDAGIPRPADRGPGRLPPPDRPRRRPGRGGSGGGTGTPHPLHRLPGHRPGPAGSGLLGLLHPVQPHRRRPPARPGRLGRRGAGLRRPVSAGWARGSSGIGRPHRRRWAARWQPGCSPQPYRSSPTSWRCAGCRRISSASS